MHTKRRQNNVMGGGNGGGQQRHHNNNRPRRFGTGNRPQEGGANVAHTRRNALQNREKYQNMARDAMSMGDRVLAENFLQHADHYHRVLLSLPPEEPRQQQYPPRTHPGQNGQGEQAAGGHQEESQEADNGGHQHHHAAPMPSADALPTFITQQPPIPQDRFED